MHWALSLKFNPSSIGLFFIALVLHWAAPAIDEHVSPSTETHLKLSLPERKDYSYENGLDVTESSVSP